MDLTPFNERIRQAIAYKESALGRPLSEDEIADEVGLKQQSINYLKNGAKSSRKIPELAAFFGVRSLWLSQGQGPMADEDSDAATVLIAKESSMHYDAANTDLIKRINNLSDSDRHSLDNFIRFLEWNSNSASR